MDFSRLTYLFEQYQADSASDEELNELFSVLGDESNREALLVYFENSMREAVPDEFPDIDKWKPVIEKISADRPEPLPTLPAARRVGGWWRYVAAAVIASMLGVGVYYVWFNKNKDAAIVKADPVRSNDVDAPKTYHAFVTLANGDSILLDSISNGSLVKQGSSQLVKLADGKIAYEAGSGEIVYNTLSNPRGSKVVNLTLADGSMIWLNAASSIRYPTSFTGSERVVEITGEAYFEIASLRKMPFIVKHHEASVKVLGTHFNVNAYDNEAAIAVTLLEGSVELSSLRVATMLRPGQQGAVSAGKIDINQDVDIEAVMAWKNGKFSFGEKADIQSIMRQIARWYDVEVAFAGNMNALIGGSISRDVPLSEVLKLLEKTGVVKFKIEGNKITVYPK